MLFIQRGPGIPANFSPQPQIDRHCYPGNLKISLTIRTQIERYNARRISCVNTVELRISPFSIIEQLHGPVITGGPIIPQFPQLIYRRHGLIFGIELVRFANTIPNPLP